MPKYETKMYIFKSQLTVALFPTHDIVYHALDMDLLMHFNMILNNAPDLAREGNKSRFFTVESLIRVVQRPRIESLMVCTEFSLFE